MLILILRDTRLRVSGRDIYRDIASLETIKVEDDLQTAQLNKLVENLESSLESYKSVLYRDLQVFMKIYF